MSDLEMTKLCAEAMGMENPYHPGDTSMGRIHEWNDYDPLRDDAQAMALVKHFRLDLTMVEKVDGRNAGWWRVDAPQPHNITCRHADLNRAICACVAKMQDRQ